LRAQFGSNEAVGRAFIAELMRFSTLIKGSILLRYSDMTAPRSQRALNT
jgi:hypothetical protein